MGLKLIGAGLPRTGTTSMKVAIEQLTGGRCYHMMETGQDGHVELWNRVIDGDLGALDGVLEGYVAAIDFPASLFWRKLAERYPDASVVLSMRRSPDQWWASADKTVWAAMRERQAAPGKPDPWTAMSLRLMERFTPDWTDEQSAMAARDAHVASVRSGIDTDRLVEMTPEMGWEPLCVALDLPVPDDDYPRQNDTASFRRHHGWS